MQHRVYFVEIKAKEETARKRLQENRKYSEADVDVYKKINDKFEPFTGDSLQLWSDEEETESMMKRAEEYIHG
jgi:predicted kinase